jgi:hypothetical protein
MTVPIIADGFKGEKAIIILPNIQDTIAISKLFWVFILSLQYLLF